MKKNDIITLKNGTQLVVHEVERHSGCKDCYFENRGGECIDVNEIECWGDECDYIVTKVDGRQKIEENFKKEFKALLDKFDAHIVTSSECGSDAHMYAVIDCKDGGPFMGIDLRSCFK